MSSTGPPTGSPAIRLVLDDAAADREHSSGRTAWWLYATEVFDHLRLPYLRSASLDEAVVGPDARRGAASSRIRKACVELASAARERGMRWWTAEQINRWECTRRHVHVSIQESGQGWTVRAESDSAVHNAAIVLRIPEAVNAPQLTDGAGTITVVRRHGREFTELSADLPAGASTWHLT